MTYIVLDKPPKCRKWRIVGKPNNLPDCFNPMTDTASWWSDGMRVMLQLTEHTVRTTRNVPKQEHIKVKETREHWYEVTR